MCGGGGGEGGGRRAGVCVCVRACMCVVCVSFDNRPCKHDMRGGGGIVM